MTTPPINQLIELLTFALDLGILAGLCLLGGLLCGTVLMIWFNTRFPIHLLLVFKALGVHRKTLGYWTYGKRVQINHNESKTLAMPLSTATRTDWVNWLEGRVHPLFIELWTCPGCLSVHVAFWVMLSIVLGLQLPGFIPAWSGISLAIIGTLTWPLIANILLQKTRGK